MRKKMGKKAAVAATTIQGENGPTSVFILKNDKRNLTLKQHIQRKKYALKRKWIEAHIKAGSHSMKEVCEYIKDRYGFTEVSKDTTEYKEEYKAMRYSFLMQFEPELANKYVKKPELTDNSQNDIETYLKEIKDGQNIVETIPTEDFDIKLHIFRKQMGDINNNIHVSVEENYGYISGGSSGDDGVIKEFRKIFHDIYRYYGVTEEDIRTKSKRYDSLVRTLAV